jgi:hypothetical protein
MAYEINEAMRKGNLRASLRKKFPRINELQCVSGK